MQSILCVLDFTHLVLATVRWLEDGFVEGPKVAGMGPIASDPASASLEFARLRTIGYCFVVVSPRLLDFDLISPNLSNFPKPFSSFQAM